MAIYKDKEKGGFRKAFGIYDKPDQNRATKNIVLAIAIITAILILYLAYRWMMGY